MSPVTIKRNILDMSKQLTLREKLETFNSAIHRSNLANWELVKKEAVITLEALAKANDRAEADKVLDDIWSTVQLYQHHDMGFLPPRCPKNAKETTEAYLNRVYALGGYINAGNASNATTPKAFDLGF